MNKADVIVVGGGISGLVAANELSKKGLHVLIFEGQNRLGGRIHTIYTNNGHFELGAEFIHGDLPHTLSILKEANILTTEVKGMMWQMNTNSESPYTEHTWQWNKLEEVLRALKEEMTVTQFLDKNFKGPEYQHLRASLTGFVSGYDTADPDLASTKALQEEWLNDEDRGQYRAKNGYGELVNYLEQQCMKQSCRIQLSCTVKQIQWQEGAVMITDNKGKEYYATKVLITVPLGILISESSQCAIAFKPHIDETIVAAKKIGYGAVIKLLLHFRTAFWKKLSNNNYPRKNLNDLGFILSAATIPTWWTQYPAESSLLTGWLGGPKAKELSTTDDTTILQYALQSIADIFKISEDELKRQLLFHYIINWTTDPFAMGSYSYTTPGSDDAKKILNTPLKNTIYFCGEALSYEAEAGTVEGAIESAKNSAKQILSSL